MKAVGAVLLVIVLAVAAIPTRAWVVAWMAAGETLAQAEGQGLLHEPPPSAPLATVERIVAVDVCARSWNTQGAPCRALAALWTNGAQESAVSNALSTVLLMNDDRTGIIDWQLRRLFAACQLERRYSDAQMLRVWLSNAYFGRGIYGVTAAARGLFGKEPAELDVHESAHLAALLRNPRFTDHPDKWDARARAIERRAIASGFANSALFK